MVNPIVPLFVVAVILNFAISRSSFSEEGVKAHSVHGPVEEVCLDGTRYEIFALRLKGDTTEIPVLGWAERRRGTCAADSRKVQTRPQTRTPFQAQWSGVCICGYNMREYCDVGGGLHCISDCYDSETFEYCGYDDQYCGEC
jgi:hypothetical protein